MTEPLHRTPAEELEHLQKITAAAYQIAGAYGAPGNILDVLSGPMFATDEQVDAMLPFVPAQAMQKLFVTPISGKASDLPVEGSVMLEKELREWAQVRGMHFLYTGSWHIMIGKKFCTCGYATPEEALEACWGSGEYEAVKQVEPIPEFLPDPDKKGLVVKPEGGWKPYTVYVVDVSWRSSNPIHRALLHTGFINRDGSFGGYCEVWCNSYEAAREARDAFYLRVIQELGSTK